MPITCSNKQRSRGGCSPYHPDIKRTPKMDTRSIYTGTQSAVRDTNKVLRNTYMLLSLTLGFSAVVAGVATVMNMPPLH